METTWWQITITANGDLEDTVFWLLQGLGCQGMATQQQNEELVTIDAFLPWEARSEADLKDFAATLSQNYGITAIQWQSVPEEDWNSSWKKHWQPDPIGRSFIIYPAWIEVPAHLDRLVIRLDPGSAFGSGAHPTTRLCLEALEDLVSESTKTIVDLGCGSGILGIAAHQLGAKQIYSADTDPLAIKATRHNWQLNQLPQNGLVTVEGSLPEVLELLPSPGDGFTCNILAEPILAMIPDFARLGKWGILSGILINQTEVITTSLQAHGWSVIKLLHQEQWACLEISRG